ncbi:MAG TPA: hypothetical protein VLH86_02500 [Patescibacteria group bacterium]|nr:hypothetical protein [Patescibacteria group bacterium]
MHQAESGYVALLTVLIVGVAATAIALVLLASGADSQRSTLVVQQSKQARTLAVACAQEAAQQIHDNIAFVGSNTLTLNSQGTCTYIVARPTGTTRSISAIGTVGNVSRKILATATIGATTVTMSSWKEVTVNGPTTPAFVQVVAATPQSSPTSVAATYAAQTAGNTNVVAIGWDSTTTTISSVVDTAGNTYQMAAPTTRGTGNSQAMYYAKNITGGTPTVTVTFSAASSFPDLRIMEYSGLDAANPLDTSVSWTGINNPSDSGTLNTNYPTELIVAAGTAINSMNAAGAGYTQRIVTSPNLDLVEDKIVTTAGAYNATATASGNWVMQAVAFRAAGQ